MFIMNNTYRMKLKEKINKKILVWVTLVVILIVYLIVNHDEFIAGLLGGVQDFTR